jgi:predicted amidohydrolase
MKAALAVPRQLSTKRESPTSLLAQIRKAAVMRADLVVFPEAALTGLTNNDDPDHDLKLGVSIPGPETGVIAAAAMHHRVWAAVGLLERAHKAAVDVAESARCDARTLAGYKQAAMRAANIARNTTPDTPRRRRSVADFDAADWPPEMDRKLLGRILAGALEVWDSSRPTLPPAPGPKPL